MSRPIFFLPDLPSLSLRLSCPDTGAGEGIQLARGGLWHLEIPIAPISLDQRPPEQDRFGLLLRARLDSVPGVLSFVSCEVSSLDPDEARHSEEHTLAIGIFVMPSAPAWENAKLEAWGTGAAIESPRRNPSEITPEAQPFQVFDDQGGVIQIVQKKICSIS